jgi:hypothetical protein
MRPAILLSSILLLSAGPLSASIVLTVSPLVQSASVGSTTTVQVGISGLGIHAAPSLGAYDLNLGFDPALLSISGLTFGDPMQGDQLDLSGAGAISDFSSPTAGLVEFFEISLDPIAMLDAQQSDHFILATVVFKAIGAGNNSLVLSVNSIGDSAGAALSVGLQAGSINVVATPEPTTVGLLIASVGIFAWRWRKGSID